MQHLRGGPFAKHPELAPLFELIQEAPPIKSDPVAERKREVDFIISRVAQELCPKLGYDEPAAEKILVDALALYLKQRFHVSDLPEAPPIPRH